MGWNRRRALVLGLAVAVVGVGAACGKATGVRPAAAATGTGASSGSGGSTLTVDGVGTATGTPDLLTITLGVETRAAKATDALASNAAKAQGLIASLKQRGVADKDVATSGLQVMPTYTANGSAITGYQVDDTVTAKLRDLTGAGQVIDAAAAAAGDAIRVQGLTLSIDDDSKLADAARADAVHRAEDHARAMAAAAGATLGGLRSITDVSAVVPQPQQFGYGGAMAAAGASTPIQPGSQQLTETVRLVFNLG